MSSIPRFCISGQNDIVQVNQALDSMVRELVGEIINAQGNRQGGGVLRNFMYKFFGCLGSRIAPSPGSCLFSPVQRMSQSQPGQSSQSSQSGQPGQSGPISTTTAQDLPQDLKNYIFGFLVNELVMEYLGIYVHPYTNPMLVVEDRLDDWLTCRPVYLTKTHEHIAKVVYLSRGRLGKMIYDSLCNRNVKVLDTEFNNYDEKVIVNALEKFVDPFVKANMRNIVSEDSASSQIFSNDLHFQQMALLDAFKKGEIAIMPDQKYMQEYLIQHLRSQKTASPTTTQKDPPTLEQAMQINHIAVHAVVVHLRTMLVKYLSDIDSHIISENISINIRVQFDAQQRGQFMVLMIQKPFDTKLVKIQGVKYTNDNKVHLVDENTFMKMDGTDPNLYKKYQLELNLHKKTDEGTDPNLRVTLLTLKNRLNSYLVLQRNADRVTAANAANAAANQANAPNQAGGRAGSKKQNKKASKKRILRPSL